MYVKEFSDQGFEIRMKPSTNFILQETKNKLYLLFEIQTGEQKHKSTTKAPFNLSVVLDRSGSMQGQKLEFAKKAVAEVVSNLRATDMLHFVIYDTEVETVFEKGDLKNKKVLLQKVMNVYSASSTFLSGGLLEGANLVRKNLSKDKSNRVFIFSDGLANVGLKTLEELTNVAKQINAKGINISAFGIGEDFDEDVMQNLAVHGKGDYFFIDQADKIPNIVDEAIQGLLGLVLSNVELKFKSERGVDIKKVFTYPEKIILGDVRETEVRQVLIEIEVDPSIADPSNLLQFEVIYRTIDDIMNDKIFSDIISIPYTTNSDDIVNENDDVLLTRHLLESSEKELDISRLIETGDYQKAFEDQKALLEFLRALNLPDKDGLIKDKIEYLEKAQKSLDQGFYGLSSKYAKYSSYMHSYSKRRNIK